MRNIVQMYSEFSVFLFLLHAFVKYRTTMKIAQFYDSFCLVNTLSRVLNISIEWLFNEVYEIFSNDFSLLLFK